MLFNSVTFVFIFLPVVMLGVYFLNKKQMPLTSLHWWLICASFVFYAWWNPKFILLLSLSIVVNFFFGTKLQDRKSKAVLFSAVFFNLGLLAYFKYSHFFLSIFTGSIAVMDLSEFPLAISFFTFQQIAFLVDTYRGQTEESSFTKYCLFVSFFPQLVAGPIIRHQYVKKQFLHIRFKESNVAKGVILFILGLSKKLLIADRLSHLTTYYYSPGMHYNFTTAWLAALCFAFEIYFDFSAYSDMAIGLARMFNIVFPDNFRSPYQSTSIREFWRKWHITLSFFLRDYLYIPLGGNRHGEVRLYVSILITMFLGGLWHGANWTFIVWGVIHGSLLVLNRVWSRVPKGYKIPLPTKFSFFLSWGSTFISSVAAFVVFRADSFYTAIKIWKAMVRFDTITLPIPEIYQKNFIFLKSLGIRFQSNNISMEMVQNMLLGATMVGACFFVIWTPTAQVVAERVYKEGGTQRILFLSLLASLCMIFINEKSPFIYFVF